MRESTNRTGRLAWSDHGPNLGTPLLMIHSLGADSSMWSPQLAELSSMHRVVMVDLPGHGASSATPGPYTLEELGLDVLDVAADAGAPSFELCGISLGGLIALWLALHAADRVRTLIACNTAARIGSEAFWQERIDAVERGGMEPIREQVVSRFFTPEFIERNPEGYERANRSFAATDPVGYAACCTALRDADLRESVGAIGCPTLIVGGDQDIATPPGESVWLYEHIPGSRLRILENAAHLSNLEQPEAFATALVGFLATAGSS